MLALSAIAKEKPSTIDRIVAAALEVFSRKGMAATTREIAQVAGVNEVTLFRHFETKDQLLSAVVAEVVRAESEALDRIDLERFDLEADLKLLAAVFREKMERHQAFSRSMMAQPINPELAKKIVREVIRPVRAKFIAYLKEGQRRKLVRKMELAPAVDAFTGMIFAGVLRSSVYSSGYSRARYLKTCVDLFLHGIRVPKCK